MKEAIVGEAVVKLVSLARNRPVDTDSIDSCHISTKCIHVRGSLAKENIINENDVGIGFHRSARILRKINRKVPRVTSNANL
ncbi:MAG: hypothetical protein FWF51_04335 [Chitinivibrionia bacterium]|nr:hypothetical protein [Chitinivibrionia bacterium]